jgi:hypothetical protein
MQPRGSRGRRRPPDGAYSTTEAAAAGWPRSRGAGQPNAPVSYSRTRPSLPASANWSRAGLKAQNAAAAGLSSPAAPAWHAERRTHRTPRPRFCYPPAPQGAASCRAATRGVDGGECGRPPSNDVSLQTDVGACTSVQHLYLLGPVPVQARLEDPPG